MPARTSLSVNELRFVLHQRVAHLATASAAGNPHVIPVCFAFDGERFYIALDDKPKGVPDGQLKRVRNIQQRGEAALVIDHYDDDWSRLGYVLATGSAATISPAEAQHTIALALLRERYPQYRAMHLEERLVIVLSPMTVTSWGTARLGDATSPMLTADPNLASGRGVDFLPLARGRRSVRHFLPQPVARALIDQLLEAACWAPSPHGRQPWRFVVLTSATSKARLAQAMGDAWRRILAMDGESAAVVQARLRHSHERIENAPALVLACLYLDDLDHYPDPDRQQAEQTMAVQSLGAAVENMLLAAYAAGLDGGWMCAPLFCGPVVREALGLDGRLLPHALVTLGYAARAPLRRPRRPLAEMVTYLE